MSFLTHRRKAFRVGFQPTDIAGCELWLDAEQGVYKDAGTTLAANNETVQQWNDQSGNGNHVSQSTAVNRPTYKTSGINSKASIDFDGIGDFMDSTTPVVSAPNTVFAVFNQTTNTINGGVVWDSDSGDRHNFFWRNSSGFYEAAAVNAEVTTISTLTADYIAAVVYNGASSSIHMNGADVGDGSVDLGSNSLNGITVGALRSNITGWYMDGQIAELVVYNSVLSTADRQAVETYLADKWGITL